MAKPLSPKSKLIREALAAHPKLGNSKLAALLNADDARKDDKISVVASDVNQQRQVLRKAGKTTKSPKAPAQKVANPPHAAPARAAAHAGPVELIDRVFSLAQECGGFAELKRLVDRIAGVEGR